MKTQTLTTKSLKFFVIIVLLSIFITPESTFAQPPKWAPAHGYRAKTRHIYFPEHNFYYDIQAHNYLYLNGKNWSVSVAIPAPFININLSRAVQVQLDFAGSAPYRYNAEHCVKYKKVKIHKEKHNHGHHNHGNKHGKGHGKNH